MKLSKTRSALGLLAGATLAIAGMTGCQSTQHDTAVAANQATNQYEGGSSTLAAAPSSTCVFSGKPAKTFAQYNGQKIGFCCNDCKAKWQALSDDEKAAKLAGYNAASCTDGSCSMPGMANAAAPSSTCVFSGKPAKTFVQYNGQKIGFCCNDCKAKWQALSDDEKAAKLTGYNAASCTDGSCSMPGMADNASASSASCVFSGKPADPEAGTVNYNGTEVGFCCKKCRGKWDTLTDDQKAAKVAYLNMPATDCPMSGKPSKPSIGTVNYKGTKVGFCCNDCREEWDEATEAEKDERVEDVSN